MITCPTPHPDLFFFTYINTHAQENVMLCLLKLFALKVQIAKDWQTSELQWPSGTIWNKNSPTKYYTQNSQFFLRTYLFKPIMLGACSISIVYPWYSRCHSLPIISPTLESIPVDDLQLQLGPRHPWDRSLCFESERLHKLHMRSAAASPAKGVLGFFWGGGISMMDWWD